MIKATFVEEQFVQLLRLPIRKFEFAFQLLSWSRGNNTSRWQREELGTQQRIQQLRKVCRAMALEWQVGCTFGRHWSGQLETCQIWSGHQGRQYPWQRYQPPNEFRFELGKMGVSQTPISINCNKYMKHDGSARSRDLDESDDFTKGCSEYPCTGESLYEFQRAKQYSSHKIRATEVSIIRCDDKLW